MPRALVPPANRPPPAPAVLVTAVVLQACSAGGGPPSVPPGAGLPAQGRDPAALVAPGSAPAAAPASAAPALASAAAAPAPLPACPDDMVFVDTVHCPDTPERQPLLRCLRTEHEKANHLTICHELAPGQSCLVPLRRQRFCIDRYEYPSRKGAHPPVHVSAYDAAALCAEQGKRLCWESEWTAACEGPDKLPFPYGYARSRKSCNIDNPYINPSLERAHSGNASVSDRELRRLDQSVPSGSLDSCKSGFGVYDLTGNFDEWVLAEWPRGRSEWAGLKGGAWGHVRNACRPITTSHVPQFIYYFISFRCCRDPDPSAPGAAALPQSEAAAAPLWTPPPARSPRPRGSRLSRGWTPGAR